MKRNFIAHKPKKRKETFLLSKETEKNQIKSNKDQNYHIFCILCHKLLYLKDYTKKLFIHNILYFLSIFINKLSKKLIF